MSGGKISQYDIYSNMFCFYGVMYGWGDIGSTQWDMDCQMFADLLGIGFNSEVHV